MLTLWTDSVVCAFLLRYNARLIVTILRKGMPFVIRNPGDIREKFLPKIQQKLMAIPDLRYIAEAHYLFEKMNSYFIQDERGGVSISAIKEHLEQIQAEFEAMKDLCRKAGSQANFIEESNGLYEFLEQSDLTTMQRDSHNDTCHTDPGESYGGHRGTFFGSGRCSAFRVVSRDTQNKRTEQTALF